MSEPITYETFGPGDVVRHKRTGYLFTLAENGYYDHTTRRVYESDFTFTSEFYERVG